MIENCKMNKNLNPLTCHIRFPPRLSGPSCRLPFPPLLAACSLFSLLRPCNLSLLFYLPEGECFWITGLINKVNTDGPPLAQHGADREAAGDRGFLRTTALAHPRRKQTIARGGAWRNLLGFIQNGDLGAHCNRCEAVAGVKL